jgi:anti-sigma28 factor (negative regulator of flagellin synthesis)
MRIHDPNLSGPAASRVGSSDPLRGDGRRKGVDSAAGNGDEVQLSSLASALHAESSEGSARLERLALEVQSGRYQVDSLTLSRSIIDEALKDPAKG